MIVYSIALIVAVLCLTGCDWFVNPDETPPCVVITYPMDGAYLTEPDTIKAEAVDNDAVVSVAFLIDGDEFVEDNKSPYEQYWDVAFWADGDHHTILARATDEAGNVSLSNLVTVRVSSSAGFWPEIVGPAEDSVFVIASPVTFRWHSVRSAVHYELEISPSYGFTENIITVVIPETTTTVTDLDEGSYYWRVRGLNNVGRGSGWSEVRQLYLAANLSDVLIFTEYELNPIISQGDVDWDSRNNLTPRVIYENGLYQMWFSSLVHGHYSISYATSADGIDWNIRAEPVLEPIITGEIDEVNLGGQFVMKSGDGYRMYYSAESSAGTSQIFLATSTDGVTWERYSSEPIIGIGAPGEFDSKLVVGAHILYRDGTYYMWYNGGNGEGYYRRIGLAFSEDGFSWRKYEANPVMEPDAAAFEGSTYIAANWVDTLPDGRFEMFYGWWIVGERRYIGRAWSSDGITWSRDPFNPIISTGAEGTWNVLGSSNACVLRNGEIYHIWFSGDSGHGWSIGFGTARCQE